MEIKHYYRPQRSWGKVIFSEACVKNSVHRGGACVAGGVRGGRACMAGGHVWHPRSPVPPRQILRDAVNERAARILLKCILVFQIHMESFFCTLFYLTHKHWNRKLIMILMCLQYRINNNYIIKFIAKFNCNFLLACMAAFKFVIHIIKVGDEPLELFSAI